MLIFHTNLIIEANNSSLEANNSSFSLMCFSILAFMNIFTFFSDQTVHENYSYDDSAFLDHIAFYITHTHSTPRSRSKGMQYTLGVIFWMYRKTFSSCTHYAIKNIKTSETTTLIHIIHLLRVWTMFRDYWYYMYISILSGWFTKVP